MTEHWNAKLIRERAERERAERKPDPDTMLAEARRAVTEWEQSETGSRTEREAAERATSALAALDDWLSHGGPLPAAWRKPGGGPRGVTNIPEGQYRILGIPVMQVPDGPRGEFRYSLNPVTEAAAVERLAVEMANIPLAAPAAETMRATVIRAPDPDVHEHLETLTDGDGRTVAAAYDYGDLLFGMYRLTRAVRDRLRELFDETDARAGSLAEDEPS